MTVYNFQIAVYVIRMRAIAILLQSTLFCGAASKTALRFATMR